MRLTQKLLEKTPRPAAGQVLLWDDLVKGFGVRFTPQRTSFVVTWREPGGRRPRLNFAHWPTVSVEAAREQARERLAEQVRACASSAHQTLAQTMRQWERQQRLADAWRPRYADKVAGIISNYIEGHENPRLKLPPATLAAVRALGGLPLASVRRREVTAVSDLMPRGAAEQFLAIVSSFFGWAQDREMVEGNPARHRLRLTGGRRKRTRKLTDAEVLAIWRAFRAEGDPALGAFEILLLTGVRRREATLMRWAEVDLKRGVWTLPPVRRKNGKHDPEPFQITLAPRARAVLARQPVVEGNPYVFWGRRDGKAFDFHHALFDRVHAAAGVEDWVPHDLRRYMRTTLAAAGISQVVAEICLGHLSPKGGIVGVYDQHTYEKEMKAAWLKMGKHVEALEAKL